MTLIHSPLVGPSTWRAVARCLTDAGHIVVLPDLRDAMRDGPPFAPRIAAACANPGDEPTVLVGHSRAGLHLPAIAAAIGRPVTSLIFVDARRSQVPPDGRLRGLARDGVLPPWHEWFAPATIDALIPDPQSRSGFVAEVPTVKLEYFDEPLPPEVWTGPTGYLLLSEHYRDQAQADVVIELITHHLAMLSSPSRVASALLDLATR